MVFVVHLPLVVYGGVKMGTPVEVFQQQRRHHGMRRLVVQHRERLLILLAVPVMQKLGKGMVNDADSLVLQQLQQPAAPGTHEVLAAREVDAQHAGEERAELDQAERPARVGDAHEQLGLLLGRHAAAAGVLLEQVLVHGRQRAREAVQAIRQRLRGDATVAQTLGQVIRHEARLEKKPARALANRLLHKRPPFLAQRRLQRHHPGVHVACDVERQPSRVQPQLHHSRVVQRLLNTRQRPARDHDPEPDPLPSPGPQRQQPLHHALQLGIIHLIERVDYHVNVPRRLIVTLPPLPNRLHHPRPEQLQLDPAHRVLRGQILEGGHERRTAGQQLRGKVADEEARGVVLVDDLPEKEEQHHRICRTVTFPLLLLLLLLLLLPLLPLYPLLLEPADRVRGQHGLAGAGDAADVEEVRARTGTGTGVVVVVVVVFVVVVVVIVVVVIAVPVGGIKPGPGAEG
ncbi:hypothetical protein VTK26DRAFT_688 [Humicola hyalothermophila]